MNFLSKIIFFSITIIVLTQCNRVEKKNRKKYPNTDLTKDNNNIVIKKTDFDYIAKNPTVVFSDFEIKFYDYEVRSDIGIQTFEYEPENPGIFRAKKDTIILVETPAEYLSYSKIRIISKQKNATYRLSIAMQLNIQESYFGNGDDYDEWFKNSFKWSALSKYQSIIREKGGYFRSFDKKVDTTYLSAVVKKELQLRDTLVLVPQIIDTRKEYYEVNLVRQDGKLCGYSIDGAFIRIEQYLGKRLIKTKYINLGFEDEY